jgi:aldehyde dehydrogenase (NAD+)
MKTRETTTPVRAFDRAYINGQFVTPHGTQVVDLVNPTDNKVIGKVTARDFDRDLPAGVLLDQREREVY